MEQNPYSFENFSIKETSTDNYDLKADVIIYSAQTVGAITNGGIEDGYYYYEVEIVGDEDGSLVSAPVEHPTPRIEGTVGVGYISTHEGKKKGRGAVIYP